MPKVTQPVNDGVGTGARVYDLVSKISAVFLIFQSSQALTIPLELSPHRTSWPWAPPQPPGSALGSQGAKARQASHQHSSCHWEHSCQQG